jgi:hypothetical protein
MIFIYRITELLIYRFTDFASRLFMTYFRNIISRLYTIHTKDGKLRAHFHPVVVPPLLVVNQQPILEAVKL